MLLDLSEFVVAHTARGECQCGQCIDRGGDPPKPSGHTVDMVFFKVALRGDESRETIHDEFLALSLAHQGGYGSVDPFNGTEHNFMELGAWLDSQEIGLRYMALGVLLGAFRLLTPRDIFGIEIPDDEVQHLAGLGLVSISAVPIPVSPT